MADESIEPIEPMEPRPEFAHEPVLVGRILDLLVPALQTPGAVFVDLTLGLGGHTEAAFDNVGGFVTMVKSGQVRILGVMDKQESAMAPGVKTAESQGFKVYGAAYRGIYAPAGTPKEIVDVLSNAVKKITADSDYLKKMEEMGHIVRYMGPDEVDKYWTDLEPSIKPLIEQAMAETK